MVINTTPKNNSQKEIIVASWVLTIIPLNIENRAPKKEESKANRIPVKYAVSTLKIIYKPTITINPKTTSYLIIFLLKKMGSNNEVKKAPVDIIANVIDTLDTLTALKKANQCKAIKNPMRANITNDFKDTFNLPLVNQI